MPARSGGRASTTVPPAGCASGTPYWSFGDGRAWHDGQVSTTWAEPSLRPDYTGEAGTTQSCRIARRADDAPVVNQVVEVGFEMEPIDQAR